MGSICADPRFKPLCPKCDSNRVEAESHLFGLLQGYQCKACYHVFDGTGDDNFSCWDWCSSCGYAVSVENWNSRCWKTSDRKHTLERRRWRTKDEV